MSDHAAYDAAERQRAEDARVPPLRPRLDERTLAETCTTKHRAERRTFPSVTDERRP